MKIKTSEILFANRKILEAYLEGKLYVFEDDLYDKIKKILGGKNDTKANSKPQK